MAAVAQKGDTKSHPSSYSLAELQVVINGTLGDSKTRQMDSFTLDDAKNPLTTYFGVPIAVRSSSFSPVFD